MFRSLRDSSAVAAGARDRYHRISTPCTPARRRSSRSRPARSFAAPCPIERYGWCENGPRSITTSWSPIGSELRFLSSQRRSHRCHERIASNHTEVQPLAKRWVPLTFADGAVHEVDLAGLLQAGGVFASIRDDRKIFEAVAVDHEFGTIEWPGDIDLDPGAAARRCCLHRARSRGKGERCVCKSRQLE